MNAYVVDPVTVDEWQPCARFSGSPLIERVSIGHALNTKAVARRYARGLGRRYEEMRLIVVHMGSGITVSAHRGGRMIDSNSIEEGPFGPDRTGSLPVRELIKLCFSGTMTESELDRHVFGDGGLFAYLGTRDLMEVERRIDAGDGEAAAVFEAMVYQIGKETGAMAAALRRGGWGQGGRRAADRRHGAFGADGGEAARLCGLDCIGGGLSGRRRAAGAGRGRVSGAGRRGRSEADDN